MTNWIDYDAALAHVTKYEPELADQKLRQRISREEITVRADLLREMYGRADLLREMQPVAEKVRRNVLLNSMPFPFWEWAEHLPPNVLILGDIHYAPPIGTAK